MSTSIDGSVNGKKDGRKRIFTSGTSKNALQNSSQDPLEVAQMGALVDDEALDLVEHRRVRLVAVAAIGAAGADDADRRLLAEHGADLHRARMGAQHLALAIGVGVEEEGVVHLARRMARREVQRGEIVEVGLDIRPLGDREAHVGEDGGELVHHLADRVDAPARDGALRQRQGDVDGLGREARVERGVLQGRAAFGQRRRARGRAGR